MYQATGLSREQIDDLCTLIHDKTRDDKVTCPPILGLFKSVLNRYVPTADELDERTQYVVDGTLLPCWSWASCPGLYSGKHKTTGMSMQVACTRMGLRPDQGQASRHVLHA